MSAPLALTMGDPAGIGAEIAAAAWQARTVARPFFLIADPEAVAAATPGTPLCVIAEPGEAAEATGRALPVLAHPLAVRPAPGAPDPANAPATIGAIDRAVALTQTGEASAVVTNPINKKQLYDGAGFGFPGHTEYLAHLAGVPRTVMMIAAPGLRVVPVTIHIPLADVPGALTEASIVETVEITARALRTDFGIAAPRIAVAGLNPHAGEEGAMGREEIDVIAPALRTLAARGIDVRGPLPADTMFHPPARARYDAAVTMYHDQGLVPVKTLDFARGVNVTLGLPFIRTSPDHGTAYDIAGTGRAEATSLIEALCLAAAMADARGL